MIGMHRSGTSLVAGTLEDAGLYLGPVNRGAPHNLKGNREHLSLRALHDRMLRDRGHDWRNPPPQPIAWTSEERARVVSQLADFRDAPRWGFKDPRTLWLLEGYLELFPNAHLVAPFRHPDAVAASLHARPGRGHLRVSDGLELWRRTNERLLEVAEEREVIVVRFSDAGVDDPLFGPPLARFLASQGLPPFVHGFFDRGLVHQPTSTPIGSAEAPVWDRLIGAAVASSERLA